MGLVAGVWVGGNTESVVGEAMVSLILILGCWLGTGPGGGQWSYDPSNNVIHYHTDQLLPR